MCRNLVILSKKEKEILPYRYYKTDENIVNLFDFVCQYLEKDKENEKAERVKEISKIIFDEIVPYVLDVLIFNSKIYDNGLELIKRLINMENFPFDKIVVDTLIKCQNDRIIQIVCEHIAKAGKCKN